MDKNFGKMPLLGYFFLERNWVGMSQNRILKTETGFKSPEINKKD